MSDREEARPPGAVTVIDEGALWVGEGCSHYGAVGTPVTRLPGRGPGHAHIFQIWNVFWTREDTAIVTLRDLDLRCSPYPFTSKRY